MRLNDVFLIKILLKEIILIYLFILIKNTEFDPVNTYRAHNSKKCQHQKKTFTKRYLGSPNVRKISLSNNEIQFEKIRMHFDYTLTLPYEEKMLRELVIPPVKLIYENALSVRRFPGKIKIPRNLEDCQSIPIPNYLYTDGAEADLIIIISTVRGLKKYNYLKNLKNLESLNLTQLNNNIQNNYIQNFFISKFQKNKRNNLRNSQSNNSLNNTQTHNSSIYNSTGKTNLNTTTVKKNISDTNSTKLPWEINDGPPSIVGWSTNCLQDLYTLRPILGLIQYVDDIHPSPRNIEEAVWTTLHEFAHVLGMDYDLYSDFVDKNLNRKTYNETIKMKSQLKGLQDMIDKNGMGIEKKR